MPTKYKFYTREDYAIRRVDVHLAKKLGLNESIVLMQIDYLINLESNDKYYDGSYWIYDSVEDFTTKYFNFWSPSTVKRVLNSLMKENLIKKGNYNKAKFDKTVWYTINYEEASKLNEILVGYTDEKGVTQALGQNDPTRRSDWSNEKVKMTHTIPKSTTKNTPENTSAKQTENAKQDNETYPITDTKPILNNAETIPSDTNPNTDKAEHSKTYFLDKIHNEIQNTKINAKYKEELMAQLKKESFVAGQARSKLIDDMDDKDFCAFYELLSSDETNFLHSDYWHRFGSIEFATEPPKINRSNLRKKHKIKLPQENFYELLDYRDAGFGGKADIVDAYVQHEMKLWDFKKTPLNDAVVFFQKEICFGHPVARHYLNMTPEQRQRELELYAQ